jgi:hypothetical protein
VADALSRSSSLSHLSHLSLSLSLTHSSLRLMSEFISAKNVNFTMDRQYQQGDYLSKIEQVWTENRAVENLAIFVNRLSDRYSYRIMI